MEKSECKTCNVVCSDKYNLARHCLSAKHQKSQNKQTCEACSYSTCVKSDFLKHLGTNKHQTNTNVFTCVVCEKKYKSRMGLWRHGKLCKPTTVEQVKQDPNLIQYVMEQLTKQNETIQMLTTKIGNNNVTNSIISNSNNKQFNLQFFLNEQCKDAVNWTDFIQNITVSLSDMDVCGNITEKVTVAICSELDRLGLYKRPLHCTDVKRSKTCVKDNNEWKRDAATLVRDGIFNVAKKFQEKMNDWTESHPNWHEDEQLTEQYVAMVSVYMKEPDDDKCATQICKLNPIEREEIISYP